MAATTLATVRTALKTTLDTITTAQTYRRRQTNYQYPCLVVGWPEELDVRPAQGEARDMTIPIIAAVEVTDDDSADDSLSGFLETAVALLLTNPAWDVMPATAFDEQQTDDGRTIITCVLPVKVLA